VNEESVHGKIEGGRTRFIHPVVGLNTQVNPGEISNLIEEPHKANPQYAEGSPYQRR